MVLWNSKKQWRILKQMPSYPIEKQAKIIVTCMALHNFIRDSALYDDDFENYEDDSLQKICMTMLALQMMSMT